MFPKLSLKEVYGKINSANYCLLFLNNVYNFALSTKFCEYISQKKKILIISSKGPASDFIVNNKLGFWINPENVYAEFLAVLQNTVSGNAQTWDSAFDVNEFSVETLTTKLECVINSDYSADCDIRKKNLLITLDYELYLGELSGSVEKCILEPAEKLRVIFKENKLKKIIFFLDTTYLFY